MKRSEVFFKSLIDNTRELICYHEPDGTYLYVSPSITSKAGYLPEDLIGKKPYEFFHPDDRKRIESVSHQPSLQGDEVPFIEYRFKTKANTFIWLQTLTTPILNKRGEVQNLLTSSRDISNLVELREKLISKDMLLEDASYLTQTGAWELDAKTLVPTQTKTLFHILETDENEGLSLEDSFKLFPAEAQKKIRYCVKEALEKGQSWDLILPINTAKNNPIWIRSIGKARMVNGEVTKVYGVIQDVSNHIETQMKLESLVDTLTKQKNHLEDFNHIISHNLRSPVNNLSLLVSHLEECDSEQVKGEIIDHIKKVSGSISRLLDELVDVVKVIQSKDLEIEEVNFREVINKSKTILNGQIQQQKPEISTNLSAWTDIMYPRVYLESIVLNFLSNSLKYSSPERRPEIMFSTFVENGRKGFVIRDNGLGMDLTKNGNRLFELNRTFHKNINGKGMGLFMTKKQIESMGGEVAVESKPDKGTEFKVILT